MTHLIDSFKRVVITSMLSITILTERQSFSVKSVDIQNVSRTKHQRMRQ